MTGLDTGNFGVSVGQGLGLAVGLGVGFSILKNTQRMFNKPRKRKTKKQKGWQQESTRHSLARKGIKTGKKKYPIKYIKGIATTKVDGKTLKGKNAYAYVFMKQAMSKKKRK
jgi:hypothetical protein